MQCGICIRGAIEQEGGGARVRVRERARACFVVLAWDLGFGEHRNVDNSAKV